MLLETLDDVLLRIRMAKTIRLVQTKKNRKTKYLLGLTDEDLKDIVRGLQRCDYYKGPEGDHDGSTGDIWVFKKREYGEWFGYLRRDGLPTEPACKGHTYKGPFHVMRMLSKCMQLLEDWSE